MTIGRLLVFEGTAFDWSVAALTLALFAVLAILAVRRPDRRRLGLRIGLSGIAVIALAVIAWQPQRLAAPRNDEAALLITPGASLATVARLADSLGAGLYALPDAREAHPAGRSVTVVPDVGVLLRRHPEIGTVHLVGAGLPRYDLARLQGVAVQAYPAPLPPGVLFVDVPRAATVGRTARVQGQITLDDAPAAQWPATLYLEDPGSRVDSVMVETPGPTRFSLETVPRQAGQYSYRLALVDARGDTLAAEVFGMAVQDPAPLRVLVLQGSPRFETRHLQDWLAAQGGRMAIRIAISRDRYRTTFLNLPERDLTRLTPGVLRAFDVVLLDARSLDALTGADRGVLERAVVEDGLGLLLAADLLAGRAGTPGFFQGFRGQPLGTAEDRRVRLTWDGTALASPIPAAPFAIGTAGGAEPLMRDEAGHAVAAVRQQGLGRVGLSLVAETYRWVLEGNAGMHAAYWSHLLSALARAPDGADHWVVGRSLPVFRDAPAAVVLQTEAAAPQGLVYATDAAPDTLYLAQDPAEPTWWRGTLWPREAGWHRVTRGEGAAESWFYVHPPETWQALQAAENTAATRQYAAASPSPDVARAGPPTKVPVPLGGVFVLFLLSAAALWLEGKL